MTGSESPFSFLRTPQFLHFAGLILGPTFVGGAVLGAAVQGHIWSLLVAAALCLVIVLLALSEATWR